MWLGMVALVSMTFVTGVDEPEAGVNLKPVPWPGGWYGDLGSNDNLRVKIKNVSKTGTAPASHTRVRFTASGQPNVTYVRPTPALGPGEVKIISVPLPSGLYWDPDLDYSVTADCRREVVETNEDDNVAGGTILG
jgi:subtilase family serine protease